MIDCLFVLKNILISGQEVWKHWACSAIFVQNLLWIRFWILIELLSIISVLTWSTLVRFIWAVIPPNIDVVRIHNLARLPVYHATEFVKPSLDDVLRVLFWKSIVTNIFFVFWSASWYWVWSTFHLLCQSSSQNSWILRVDVFSWPGALFWWYVCSVCHVLSPLQLLGCMGIFQEWSLLQTFSRVFIVLSTHFMSCVSGLNLAVLVRVLTFALHVCYLYSGFANWLLQGGYWVFLWL